MYRLEREQEICSIIQYVRDFIKNPKNLNTITPPELDFKIVSNVPDVMHDGLEVEYDIQVPFFGRRKWLAELKHIREPFSFVDEQRLGPYSFWYHYHELVEQGDRVKIIDRVFYEVPYGLLGKAMHALFVRKTLERIFHFRKEKLAELLSVER